MSWFDTLRSPLTDLAELTASARRGAADAERRDREMLEQQRQLVAEIAVAEPVAAVRLEAEYQAHNLWSAHQRHESNLAALRQLASMEQERHRFGVQTARYIAASGGGCTCVGLCAFGCGGR